MFAEYGRLVSEAKRANLESSAIYCAEYDHPEYCDCQVAKKLEQMYESACFHWEAAMERAREEGEQKRQRALEEFAALKEQRRQIIDGQQS